MKLHQIEYCHNCNKHVRFEFEDVTGNQLILCPDCGHQHYREIDEGALTEIRVGAFRPGMKIVRIEPIPVTFRSRNSVIDDFMPIQSEEVIGVKNGNAIIKGKGEKIVTDRRWGVDPRQ